MASVKTTIYSVKIVRLYVLADFGDEVEPFFVKVDSSDYCDCFRKLLRDALGRL